MPENPTQELEKLREQYQALKDLFLIEKDEAHKRAYLSRLERCVHLSFLCQREAHYMYRTDSRKP